MEIDNGKLGGKQTAKTNNSVRAGITDEEVNRILKNAREQLEEKTDRMNLSGKAEKVSGQETPGKADKIDKREPLPSRNSSVPVKSEEPEEGIFIDNSALQGKERLSVGRVIGAILEGIWTGVKLIVVLGIVTVVVGFLLSRSLLVRGRNGSRECLSGMLASGAVAVNKLKEEEKVAEWLKTVKREKITMETDDKRILVARKIVVDKNSDKWAVVLHGFNGCMEDIYDIAMHYASEGYNILTPDLRANGESEGAFLGMGWLDRLDVINWLDVILEENPSAKFVVHGVDMGADTALMLSGESIKDSVKAVVAEGAYTSAWEVVKKEYKARHENLPVFPFMHMMTPVMKVWTGYSLKEADAEKQVKNATVPILLISGKNDTYASEDMTGKLNRAIASYHELLSVETGTHGDCRYAEPDNYYGRTFDFIGNYVN